MTGFWGHLTVAERQAFSGRSFRRSWRGGAVLCRQGDPPDWVALLLTGHVKVSLHTADGDTVMLAICGPGALIGDLSAIDRRPRSGTVEALGDVTAALMPMAALDGYLDAHRRVGLVLTQEVTRRLRDADRTRVELSVHSAADRLAARIVELADRFGRPHGGSVHIGPMLSQDDLAHWVGASREAIAKTFTVWRRQGWIRTGRRSVTVLDLEALRRRAGSSDSMPQAA
ncbi:Crp/Fnr family transcriptional regulator [Dactylosporangium siamense]|uniref:Transcriptional regulator n=1 Tax=Dactylosporangium siamense TaxID=685454 RepID=A0A919UG04_9ACTN|nr:Crp/Fnr family transcriptional regulator [Dactylosporangium siamense]GIG49168.1 transcriptional regulator [Dactylosporangium siamense]